MRRLAYEMSEQRLSAAEKEASKSARKTKENDEPWPERKKGQTRRMKKRQDSMWTKSKEKKMGMMNEEQYRTRAAEAEN